MVYGGGLVISNDVAISMVPYEGVTPITNYEQRVDFCDEHDDVDLTDRNVGAPHLVSIISVDYDGDLDVLIHFSGVRVRKASKVENYVQTMVNDVVSGNVNFRFYMED